MNFIYSRWYTILLRVTDVILLSILWAIVSTPLITLYPATIALMETINHWDDDGTTGRIWLNFFSSFKSEIKKKLLLSSIWLVVFVSIYLNYTLYFPTKNQFDVLILSLIFISNLLSIMFFFVTSLVWSRSEIKITFKELFLKSLELITSRFFRTVLVTVITFFLIECTITIPVISFLIGIPIALLAVILSNE